MDLSKLLNEPEGEKEGQWRDKLYKRRNMAFDTNARERRTLKSMQASERRKSSRQSHQFAGRKFDEDIFDEVCGENDENKPTTVNLNKLNTKSKIPKENVELPTKSKTKSRKEKLAEYLDQKKKLEDVKRKHAKPAFKVGIVHHPMAPIGAGFHKPNVFSTILNSSRSVVPSPKVAARVPKVKTKTTTESVTGRVTRSKAAVAKSTSNTKPKQVEVIKPRKVALKSSKTPKRQIRASFAPDNFEFKLNLPLNSVVEEPNEYVEDVELKASTPVKVTDEDVEKVIPSLFDENDPKMSSLRVTAPTSELPKTPEPVQLETRGRRRSRRISGVQPDPTLTQDELSMTPAKRAKDRSASRDRRMSQCKVCPGDHSCATPRATPRISRKSTLPALSEVDSGNDITDAASSVNHVDEADSNGNDVDEAANGRNVITSEVAAGGNVDTPDKLSNLARIAVEIPLPTTEKKGRSRRSLRVKEMEVEPVSPALPKPAVDKVEESADTPVSTLSKSMDRASLESAKKEHAFKTPLKSAKKAVSKSASKSLSSWITSSRGSSKRKRNESPIGYSVPDMFENLEGSPLLAKLEKKMLSNENISEADFEEFEEVPVSKQRKLDKNFEEIAVEESKEKEKSLDVVDTAASSTEELGVPYFRNLLVIETKRITEICNNWEKKLESNLGDIPDDIQGEIRSVIGQGRLVMAERFGQFSGLVDNCEYKRGEKETTCTDLMGFWEMIYFQVEDVNKKFAKLSEIEANKWTEIVKQVVRKKMVKKPIVAAGPKKVASSGLKALIAAKRKAAQESKAALAASEEVKEIEVNSKVVKVESSQPKEEENVGSKRLNIREMIAKKREQLAKEKAAKESITKPEIVVNIETCEIKAEERTFEGGFFSVTSPIRSTSSDIKENSSKSSTPSPSVKSRRSVGDKLRKSVLKESAKRMSGLVSPFVSQIARRSLQGNSDAQPTVLFKDIEYDEPVIDSNAKTVEVVTAPLIELVDPIAPLSSPVTKTYSKSGMSPAAKQRQIDAFDLMVVGTSPKMDNCYLEPSTPEVIFTDDVELISFDSPAESGAVTASPEEAATPTVSKSKIPVKTPSRRSTRVAHTPK